MRRVLIVDDEESLRHMLQLVLDREGYQTVSVSNVDGAIAELDLQPFDIVITDLRMPGKNGMELVDEIRERGLQTTVFVMTAYGSREVALEAMKRGAYDYLSKPFDNDELVLLLNKAEERERLFRENTSLRRQLKASEEDAGAGLGGMVAKSDVMRSVFAAVRKLAEFKTTVLLQGESGTGKELVARALHQLSPRARRPFVAVNCGAIPEHLLESELFGHKRGAFTDAVRDRQGLFEEADGGTLFLDEIGELPTNLQVKLLRVLQEGEVRRLGESKPVPVDVRVVAASLRDLDADVASGRFREDLLYRLNVVSVKLPALRERREDIPLLINHFIDRMNGRMGMNVRGVEAEAMRLLIEADWPGNVRELENCVERAMILSEGGELQASAIAFGARRKTEPESQTNIPVPSDIEPLKDAVRRTEQSLIRSALQASDGNRTKAAKLLGISHRALLYKIKEYDLVGVRGDASHDGVPAVEGEN